MRPEPLFRPAASASWLRSLILSASALALTPVAASTLHAGDIFPMVEAGQIRIANGATISATSAATHAGLSGLAGQRFFSGDFGDLRGGPLVTDNPGFDWKAGVWPGDTGFPTNSLLGLQAVGALGFWNGTTWVAAPTGAAVSVDDVLGHRVTWSGTGVATDPYGFIGQSVAGSIHSHLNFSVNDGSPVGAWLINLRLFSQVAPADLFNPPPPSPANRSPGIADSAPLTLVFNRGLDAAAFTAAVDSLSLPPPPVPQQVPLPVGGLIAGFALCVLSGGRRLGLSAA